MARSIKSLVRVAMWDRTLLLATHSSSVMPIPQAEPRFTKESAYSLDNLWDAILRTSDMVDLRVHSYVLAHASPYFNKIFGEARPSEQGHIVVDLDEHSRIINLLLHHTYPEEDADFDELYPNMSVTYPVLQAAEKYSLLRATQYLRRQVKKLVSEDPVLSYTFASRENHVELMHQTARAALSRGIESLVGNDMLDDTAFERFREYHYWSGKVATKCLMSAIHSFVLTDTIVPVWRTCSGCEKVPVATGSPLVAQWFYDYVERTAHALASCPSGSVLADPERVCSCLMDAAGCADCRLLGYAHLQRFNAYLAPMIESAIDKQVTLRVGDADN
ncbi:hypothetical protein K474DRAFT_1666799 [Panus rudis PR-1116 ss-1]|nr:hypothetical protein K474DRAFT_1666799 [Panus rudis PR-1116 ss-1]